MVVFVARAFDQRQNNLTNRLESALGVVTVLITHNAAIGAMADRVLWLHDGAIAREVRNPSPADPATIGW